MVLIMMAMYTTAHHKIRQQCFEAFWYLGLFDSKVTELIFT